MIKKKNTYETLKFIFDFFFFHSAQRKIKKKKISNQFEKWRSELSAIYPSGAFFSSFFEISVYTCANVYTIFYIASLNVFYSLKLHACICVGAWMCEYVFAYIYVWMCLCVYNVYVCQANKVVSNIFVFILIFVVKTKHQFTFEDIM